MDKQLFSKEHYFFELSRRHLLTNALAIPIGVLTVLGGIVAYFLNNFELRNDFSSISISVLVLISLVYMGRTIYFLIRSYHNYIYGYIATPKELFEYHKQLIDYYTSTGDDINRAEQELENYIANEYAKYAHQNAWNNDSKSEFLHKANSNLIYSLMTIILCSIPFYFSTENSNNKPQKIEIVGIEKLTSTGEEIMTNKPSSPPPQKPEPPPGREFKEGVQPPQKNVEIPSKK